MLLKLAFRNIFTRKSSYVIILFITFAVMLFCVANAVFDSTEQGVENCFTSGFTGDVFIRPTGNSQVSLFGDDTPVTGELSRLECVVPYADIFSCLSESDMVKGFTGQVTCAAYMQSDADSGPIYVFGVTLFEYADLMPSLHFVDGGAALPGEKAMIICSDLAEQYGVSVGDTLQFTVKEGPSARIRAALITGIIDYETPNDIFSNFILLDTDTAHSLIGMSNAAGQALDIAEEDENLLTDDFDMDSLFDDAFDTDAVWVEDIEVEETEPETTDIVLEEPVTGSWNFLMVRLNEGVSSKKAIRKLNRIFKKNGWPVEAVTWRHAAGSTAMYLYWMRLIFNIGIIIVLAAGFIIINNTLVISVLDRTREFGTMRAVGAGKRYISLQCMIETFMLTISGGIIGTAVGVWVSSYITKLHITFNNSFLIQLFGSDALSVTVTPQNILTMAGISILLGLVGWIYPVITALRVTPVKAMTGSK